MKTLFTTLVFSLSFLVNLQLYSQDTNAAGNLMKSDSKLTIGGYGQIDYNQVLNGSISSNGKLDVHRMVMLFGYKFSDKTQFVTELELEHVKEVFVEQAFIDHKIFPFLSFRAGLMLVPMGITNLYHEPTAFLGVERPNIDGRIAPTTWREIGAGFAGYISGASLKYELYVMNGFVGYNGSAVLRGVDGFRKGRQKGAESFMTSPSLAGRLSYYGISGLKIGYSIYQGKTQTSLFNGLDKNDEAAALIADSSRVRIDMHGVDIQYKSKGVYSKIQFYAAKIGNSTSYNEFTGADLGSRMYGYYVELGYDILAHTDSDYKLIPFARYENYNTHSETEGSLIPNPAFARKEITTGISFYLSEGAVLKSDLQFFGNDSKDGFETQINFGVGVWF